MALGSLQAGGQGINLSLQFCDAAVRLLLALACRESHDTVSASFCAPFARSIGVGEVRLAPDFKLSTSFTGARTSQLCIGVIWIDGVKSGSGAESRPRIRSATVYRLRRLGLRGAAEVAGPTRGRDGRSQLVSRGERRRRFGVVAGCRSGRAGSGLRVSGGGGWNI